MFRCNLQGWEVPFPAIWEAVLAKNYFVRYAPTDCGAPLRQCNILSPIKNNDPTSAPGNHPPPPRFSPHKFFGDNQILFGPPLRPNPGSATEQSIL